MNESVTKLFIKTTLATPGLLMTCGNRNPGRSMKLMFFTSAEAINKAALVTGIAPPTIGLVAYQHPNCGQPVIYEILSSCADNTIGPVRCWPQAPHRSVKPNIFQLGRLFTPIFKFPVLFLVLARSTTKTVLTRPCNEV